ncbi:MAG: CshA/CshB family fibrillar adhesin-related protein [Clostridium sp.]
MATVGFANANSGPKASSIGWFDFTGIVLPPNTSVSMANSLPNGGNIAFTIQNIMISNNLTFTGHVAPQRAGIPFGSTSYTGIPGKPIIDATQIANGRADLIISNITITNGQGVTIPFGLVVAEAEGSIQNELITCTTNGSPWDLIANIYGSVANISGINTTIVSWGGANPWPSPVVATNNPTSILVNDFQNVNSAIALGVILTQITIQKYVEDRLDTSDQFQLDIKGQQSATTITTGVLPGTQPNFAFTYADAGQTYILTEGMSPGSLNTLNQYTTTVSIVNTAQGGTTIPSNWALGQGITLALGDNIHLMITNTPIIPHLIISKATNKAYAGVSDIIEYTFLITNTYPNIAVNTVLLDTTPNGTTFVAGSIIKDGIAIQGDLNPPNGLLIGTIPANSLSTITYKVKVNSFPSIVNPVLNSGGLNHSYTVVTSIPPTFNVLSNQVVTTISSVDISSQKFVDKSVANIGDILVYTISIANRGNSIAYNITFVDTIPIGTSYIPNSLNQDNTIISGTPNLPGVILPNSILPGETSIISFKVTVVTTPGLYTVKNSSFFRYSYEIDGVTIGSNIYETNTVVTNINVKADIQIRKAVDKAVAVCGDIINYSFIVTNIGAIAGVNMVFYDTLPSRVTFIPNSFMINGINVQGGNPSNGVPLPKINYSETITLGFQARVECV